MIDYDLPNSLTRDLLPVSKPPTDRLPPMLFLASLFYALIILGITFDLGLEPPSSGTTTLAVTIVADSNQRIAQPENADYLAQANQMGHGNTREQVTPGAAPIAPGQKAPQVDTIGERAERAKQGELAENPLLHTSATAARAIYQPDEITDNPNEREQLAQALPAGSERTLPLPEDDDANLLIKDDNPRHLVVSVNTRQSDIAPYLNQWKRKVERIGTLNFPKEIDIDGLTGSPTLEVAIAPDGSLSQVMVIHSSGHVALDQAAIAVLSRAAPFASFPNSLRENYDLLRFAYKFEFRGADGSGTLTINP